MPRGHYTRSETLKRYFRAMMWYGEMTFRLDDDFETRRALLVVQALRSAQASDGRSAVELWQNIYDPTVFIVGKADDLGYHEYGAIMDQVFGPNPDPMALADETLFAEFKQAKRKICPRLRSIPCGYGSGKIGPSYQRFSFYGPTLHLGCLCF